MELSLLKYRPWSGGLRKAWATPLPIARIALWMVFRRKLFWFMYFFGLVNFSIFFSGIYLLSQIDLLALAPTGRGEARLLFFTIRDLSGFVEALKNQLHLGGDAKTYANFFWFQGYIVMAVLALAGSILIGNDYQHGSLPFYLAKPLGRWHYLTGKFLAVALFINMLTTLPALGLYAECGLLSDWSYFEENLRLLWGILGYGAILTIVLSLMVLATASWLRKTVPMIMIWAGLLIFCRGFAELLVTRLDFDPRLKLIDTWNNLYIVGANFLGVVEKETRDRPPSNDPTVMEAALVLGAVCLVCLIYLSRRIRAVEIVR